MTNEHPKALLSTCGSWYLPNTAKALEARHSLAGLWVTIGNRNNVSSYKRAWPFQLAMLPMYKFFPQIVQEKAFYWFFPLWRQWLQMQRLPDCNVIHAIAGYSTELFNKIGSQRILKVVDCPNSHPTTFHGYWQRECDLWCPGEYVPIPRWMLSRINRELNDADLIVCPSDFVRDTMISNGIDEQKCFVNPFGVDRGIFKPRKAFTSKRRFVCVGTICLRKGHQYLFRAFKILKRQFPDAELICIGDIKNDFRKEFEIWKGTFTHHVHLSHTELANVMTTCTALVLPSVEEGFARVIIEAMAVGLPIIASYESGATTLIKNDVEGLIVSPTDINQLAEAMRKIASDSEYAARLGEASRKRVENNSWQAYGDRMLAEYERRLNQMFESGE